MKHILTYIALFVSCLVYGQAGILDSSFNYNGIVTTCLENVGYYLNSIAVQQDGKIIAVGVANEDTLLNYTYSAIVIRYKSNGDIDNSFGNNGIVKIQIDNRCVAQDVKIQADGKIIVAFSNLQNVGDFGLVRLNIDGSVDSSFGTNGFVLTPITIQDNPYRLMLAPENKIVVAGKAGNSVCIVRYNNNGSLDNGFGEGGKVITFSSTQNSYNLYDLLVRPDGKIVISGNTLNTSNAFVSGYIRQYNQNGSLDSLFTVSSNFSGATSSINSIAHQPDGKIVSVGKVGSNVLIMRNNTDGSRDSSFNNIGYITTTLNNSSAKLSSVLIQQDGKILVAGSLENNAKFALIRYTIQGNLDSTFNVAGITETNIDFNNDYITSIDLQPDGKIIAAGVSINSDEKPCFALARYHSGLTIGILEFSQTETPPLLYPNPLQNTEHLKYTLAEDNQISIALFDSQGKMVTTFVENEKQAKGDHEVELTLPNNLQSGTYFIQIASPKGKISIKAIK